MKTIKKFQALQVLDSRGRPTVGVKVETSDGWIETVAVPSGASTGRHEALEQRDHGSKFEEKYYAGNSVFGAVEKINSLIAPKLIGSIPNVQEIDAYLKSIDPTSRREMLGGNATLATSLAGALAAAHCADNSLARLFQPTGALTIPMPMVNILSGGAHANGAMDIQDILVIPRGATSFEEALSWSVAIREAAAVLGKEDGFTTNLVADEGGLGIPFRSTEDACDFVVHVIESVGLNPENEVNLALDIASTQFFIDDRYESRATKTTYAPSEWLKKMVELVQKFPIISIEDPFAEDDWESWSQFVNQLPRKIQVIGDDLFTTNIDRLNRGVLEKSANSILIKVNQNGLVSDTQSVLERAKSSDFLTVVSARSGETADSWLSDLAVGWKAEQIKVGSTHGSERSSKWNRLLEFEAFEETIFAQPFN